MDINNLTDAEVQQLIHRLKHPKDKIYSTPKNIIVKKKE